MRFSILGPLLLVLPLFLPTNARAQARCDIPFTAEKEAMSRALLQPGLKVVKFWLFGPNGFTDEPDGPRVKSPKITLAKGTGYLVGTKTVRGDGPLVVTATTKDRTIVPLDGRFLDDNYVVRIKANHDCGAILLMGTTQPPPPKR